MSSVTSIVVISTRTSKRTICPDAMTFDNISIAAHTPVNKFLIYSIYGNLNILPNNS